MKDYLGGKQMFRILLTIGICLLVMQITLHAGEKMDLLMEANNLLKKGEISREQYNQYRQKILFGTAEGVSAKKNMLRDLPVQEEDTRVGVLDVTVHFNYVVGPKSYSIGKKIMVMDSTLKKIGSLRYSHHESRNMMVFSGQLKFLPGEYHSLSFNYVVGDDINSLYFYNFVYARSIDIKEKEVKKIDIRYDITENSAIIDRDIRTSVKNKDPGFKDDPLNDPFENEYERERKYHFRWKL